MSVNKLRVLALVHRHLIPPATVEPGTDVESAPWRTEYDVISTLAATANVAEACRAVSVARSTAYDWRAADKGFAKAWDEAIALGLKALYRATEGKLNASALEIGVVTKADAFRKLNAEEIKAHVDRAAPPSG